VTLDPCECGGIPWIRRAALSLDECGFEVGQDSELSEDDRPFRVAIEVFDLAVFQFEHVAARGVHLLSRRGQLAEG
jgi:hypothetical protein